MFEPAAAVAGPLFVTARSVTPMTVVLTVAVLFPLFGSKLSELATAVLESTVPPAVVTGTKTVRVKVAFPPLANAELIEHAAVFVPVCRHVAAGPVFCTNETNVVPAGKKSSMRAPMAASGPAFARVRL